MKSNRSLCLDSRRRFCYLADMRNKFQKLIAEYRAQHNISVIQFAYLIGVSPNQVYNWEKGRSTPSAGNGVALARVLGVTMDELFREGE